MLQKLRNLLKPHDPLLDGDPFEEVTRLRKLEDEEVKELEAEETEGMEVQWAPTALPSVREVMANREAAVPQPKRLARDTSPILFEVYQKSSERLKTVDEFIENARRMLEEAEMERGALVGVISQISAVVDVSVPAETPAVEEAPVAE